MRCINCVVAGLIFSTIGSFGERTFADPNPADPNLVLWMRADQGVTGTSLVTQIDDSSDNGNTMVGAGNPKLATDTFPTGDLPVIRFGGGAAFYVNTTTPLNLQNASIYMVATQLNGFFTAQCYVANFGPSGAGYAVGISDAHQNTLKFYTSHGSAATSLDPVTIPDETPFLVTTTFTSTGSKNLYLNSGPAFHEDGAFPSYAANNQFTIGGLDVDGTAGTPGQGYNQTIIGDIAEILIFDNVDNSQRASVESYLNHKYFGTAATLDGDYNADGKVDASDYVRWRNDPSSFGGTPGGYDTWKVNFGKTAGSGSSLGGAAVPEPGCFVLAIIALFGNASILRRRTATV